MFCITKWTNAITDSGKDEYTKRMPKLSNFFEVADAIREFVPDMPISKRVFIAKHISDLCRDGRTNISREGMQSIMYFLKVTHEISEYQYIRINDIILESEKLREVKQ